MKLYYAGSEVPSWRKVLSEEGVEHVALSYVGLRRRVKMARPWKIEEKYPENQGIFLDSGAYSANSKPDKYDEETLRRLAAQYMDFVTLNIERVDFVSEFDALALGPDWIAAMREDFYDDLPEGKFLPIWHEQYGLSELDRLCQTYPRVGVTQTALGGRNLVPTLNSYVRQYGTKLHGIAMTKPDLMSSIQWDSVASTSWISPSQFGDTIIWTGKEIKRYPKKMKDAARKRHRTYINEIGFDAEKIADDDTNELIRLSIWSWRQVVSSLEGMAVEAERATTSDEPAEERNTETALDAVERTPAQLRKPGATIVRPRAADRMLPVMGMRPTKETYVDPEDGVTKEREVPLLNLRSQSQRVCNSCFLAAKCPAYEADSNCAYEIPVKIETKDQLQAVQDSLIEMQTHRVMFMRMAEELEGGYADPNLSGELDRLQKLIKTKVELEQDSFSVKFEAKGSGRNTDPGLLSRLFGRDAGEQARALPAPVHADAVIQQYDVIDADVVDLPRSN